MLADLTRSMGSGSDGDVTEELATNPWSASAAVIAPTEWRTSCNKYRKGGDRVREGGAPRCVVGSREGMLCVLSEGRLAWPSTSHAPKSHFEAGRVQQCTPHRRVWKLT